MQDASEILKSNIKIAERFDPKLYKDAEAPLVSLYLPIEHTDRTSRLDDKTRDTFKDLAKTAQRSLSQTFSDERFYSNITAQMEYLLEHPDLPVWLNARSGLGFLISNKGTYAFNLDFKVEPTATVGDEYYIKPLLRGLEYQKRYYLLALSTDRFAWIEGDQDHIERIPLPADIKTYCAELFADDEGGRSALDDPTPEGHLSPYHDHRSRNEVTQEEAERFFHYVNDTVTKVLAHNDPTPVILVTLPEHEAAFRKISTIPTLLPKSILKNPDGITGDDLVEGACDILAAERKSKIESLRDTYELAASKGKASSDIDEIGATLLERKVETMFVLQGKSIPGTYDASTGQIAFDGQPDPADDKLFDPAAPDVVGSMAEAALRQDADVIVLDEAEMPADGYVAAIFRY